MTIVNDSLSCVGLFHRNHPFIIFETERAITLSTHQAWIVAIFQAVVAAFWNIYSQMISTIPTLKSALYPLDSALAFQFIIFTTCLTMSSFSVEGI